MDFQFLIKMGSLLPTVTVYFMKFTHTVYNFGGAVKSGITACFVYG